MAEPKIRPKVRGVYEKIKGSDVWWIQYFHQGRHRERAGTHANAIRLYQKRRTQILLGDKLPELQKKVITFGQLMDDAILFAKEHNKSPRDQENKAALLRPAFGSRTAEDIKPEEFASWIRRRGVAPATFNRYRAFLSLCFREGMRHTKIKTNPARLLSQKREPNGRKRFLSRKEYEAVLSTIRALYPARAAEFIVSVQTGIRLSDQARLLWKNVDLERRTLSIVDTKNGEDRTIPMTSEVYVELNRLKPKKLKPGMLVFPRPRSGELAPQPRWFTRILRSEDVDIGDYTWHNNRHTFCSWLAMAGVPLKTIQELAGHKTISITARYAHLSPDHKESEIEKLVGAGKPKLLKFPSATRTAKR